jgi:glycopeptide antibiotics resistance protein
MLSFMREFSTSFIVVVMTWLFVAALFTLPALVWQYRYYNRIMWGRIALTYLFVFYLLGLVTLTLFPLPDDFAVFCAERSRPVHWGAVPCRYRVADVDDLILNVFGTWLGVLVARLIPAAVKAVD